MVEFTKLRVGRICGNCNSPVTVVTEEAIESHLWQWGLQEQRDHKLCKDMKIPRGMNSLVEKFDRIMDVLLTGDLISAMGAANEEKWNA